MKYFTEIKEIIKDNSNIFLALLIYVPFALVHGCPSRAIFGVCCPGCGMSRAVWSALIHFDLASAIHFHPLVVLLPVAAAVWFFRKKIPKKVLTALIATALVLLLCVYIIRLSSGSDVVYIDFKRSLIYKIISSIF